MIDINRLHGLVILLCSIFMMQTASAQGVVGNKYKENNNNVIITHKAAKWFDLRKNISLGAKSMDTFDDDIEMFTLSDGMLVQAAHTYMDTIYVHKGTSVTLEIPDKLNNQPRVESYQRWYSFRTDNTFRTKNTGGNEVWDLLTPTDNNSYYRYANGYVGKPSGANLHKVNFYVPTDEEFQKWFSDDIVANYDNNYYLVACDVSAYTDYTKNFTSISSSSKFPNTTGLTYEPTLTHRIIFYIVTVDNRDTGEGVTDTWTGGMGRLKSEAYQGGTLEEGKKYLEEYDISFPFTRVSNGTKELVVLSKDAMAYAIPDAPIDEDVTGLDIKLADNGSGIKLITKSLSGMSRIINFDYPITNSDKTQSVNKNLSTATIYVTKTVAGKTYNLARYNLTFVRDTRLLTQSQVKQIEDGTIKDENLKYYIFRTDSYLDDKYQLLTELNFDYDPSVAEMYGQPEYYQFPLAWTSNSYSFFDGSDGSDFKNTNKYPEWGYYAITNCFVENRYWGAKSKAELLPGSTYHLYVDASDRPGVIARLPFRRKLCKGSEMFVTAWLKSAGWSSSKADASMLFSVMGVKTDPVLGTVYEPIYRHASGQVRRTDYLNGGMPGTGGQTNEWMQMYFSFIIDADTDYESYVLQVDNYCASTDGGDMYIDDIRVYMATPSAEVSQLEATCINERTMMSIKLDWDRLISRLGEKEGIDKIDGIDFCFIDKAKYDNYLAQHPGDFEGAVDASVVEIGNNNPEQGGYNRKYNTLYFNLNFDENTDYDDKPHPRLAIENEGTGDYKGKYFFYKTNINNDRALAVDFYSALVPNRTYMMLIQINDGNEASVDDFGEDINDPCGVNTSFNVTSQTLLRVNGEVVDPTTDFCAGQLFNFTVQLRVPIQEEDGSESYITIDKGVYFDWFFGSEEEYIAQNADFGNVSLLDALTTFREIYPDNVDLSGVTVGDPVEGEIVFTQNMYDIIKHYMEVESGDGLHAPLVLHKENLDITLLSTGLQLVVQPIPTLKSPDGSISDDLWVKVCWSYVPLILRVSGSAPQLHAGFNSVLYPTPDFNPGLRIGLKQIMSANETNPLNVSLRGAKLVSEGAEYIGMITSASPNLYNKIYLISTDDPAYNNEKYFPTNFSEFSLPIGIIKSLYAHEYETGSSFNDCMEIYFDTETTQANGFRFQPKEGYTYTFAVHFEEHGSEVSNACFGMFSVDMKVVPEYLVWKGTNSTCNWNNDDNWMRADASDLKNTDGTYTTNADNTTDNGFVPMLFSNVVMPINSKVELYIAGYGDGGNGWVNTSRPNYMQLPTENIQYDLMVYENGNSFTTQRYRVNICNDIHFENGSQMLHAEQLLYDRAWTDVQLVSGQWTGIATPLEGVVAGDWYVPMSSGKQDTEYFKDLYFTDGTNNRLNPAVYQRSWSTGATIVENMAPNTVVSFNTADWSSAYNDASVPYYPGNGFSVKAVSKNAQLLFRFPKADTQYSVSTSNGPIDRSQSGRLMISNLVDRNNPYQYVDKGMMDVELYPSADGRFLMVGNPFLAPMDVQSFIMTNSDVLAQKYWLDDNVGNVPAAVYDSESGQWSAEPYYIPPYGVFYVEALNTKESQSRVSVKFASNMQRFATVSDGDEVLKNSALVITARGMEGTSKAVLRYSDSADNGFGLEDAELIQNLDGQGENAPNVYTLADGKALCVNQLCDAEIIPLGVFASDDDLVEISFEGMDNIGDIELYDVVTRTYIPLYEGFDLTISGASHGRYFLAVKEYGTAGIVDGVESDEISVSSVVQNQIVVSSESELREISIWSVDGIKVKTIKTNGFAYTIEGVDSGMAIVKVHSDNNTVVRKISVK